MAFERFQFDFGLEHAGLQLDERGSRIADGTSRPARPSLRACGLRRMDRALCRPRPRLSTMRLSAKSAGLIGGIAKEQIRRELRLFAHRAAEQLAQPQARGLADRVEAGDFDGGIGAAAQR